MSSSPTPDARIARITSRQHGVFSRQQAIQAGFSRRQIQRRVSAGVWLSPLTAVYVLASSRITWMTWVWAGVLTGGVGAVVIGDTAAAVRGWCSMEWPITLAVASAPKRAWPSEKLRPISWVIPTDEIVEIDGLPVTTRLRTAVDVAHLLRPQAAQDLIDRLLVLEVVSLDALSSAVNASTRAGSRQARRIVARCSDFAASEAERLCHQILRSAELGWFVANFPVQACGHIYKVDLAFVTERVVIEIQGLAYHSTPEQRRADDAKLADLQVVGWLVIRLTWHDLVERPDWVVAAVRRALNRQAA